MVDNVNQITEEQLKTIDLDYLQVRQINNFVIIMGIFDNIFLARLNEFTILFSNLTYPNRIFKCYAVLIIDVTRSRYIAHRLYSFPVNVDLYNSKGRYDVHSSYKSIVKQLDDHPSFIEVTSSFQLNSQAFKCTRPISKLTAHSFDINIDLSSRMEFDIDKYIEKYIKFEGNNVSIDDDFYNYPEFTRAELVSKIACGCSKERLNLPYSCHSCDTATKRRACGGHHVKKCLCGDWTYYRENNCLKCHILYSKVSYLKNGERGSLFSFSGVYNGSGFRNYRSLSNYIPYQHYNSSGYGLCIGEGSNVITQMIQKEINPIKIMLSFKANLSYTDAESTNNYYNMYSQRLTSEQFENNQEFHSQLNNIYKNSKNVNKRHTFSIMCYCPQCFYYRLCLWQEDIKLDPKGFDVDQPYIVSRNQFIKHYKSYLNRTRSKTYIGSYIHKLIKKLANTQPSEFLIAE